MDCSIALAIIIDVLLAAISLSSLFIGCAVYWTINIKDADNDNLVKAVVVIVLFAIGIGSIILMFPISRYLIK